MKSRIKQYNRLARWPEALVPRIDDRSSPRCAEDEWGQQPLDFKLVCSPAFTRILIKKRARKSDENLELQKKIDDLEQRLNRHERLLREVFDPINLPAFGSFEEWLASGEPVSPYVGKHVAFVAGKGVIVSADSLDKLMEEVEKTGKSEGLTIGFVPLAVGLV